MATTAVIWFVVWKLNRSRRRRTKSSSAGAGESPPAEGDNIRNDLKSLNNYAQRVGYQVPGSLKITNIAAEEGGESCGGSAFGSKVAAHAREVASPELSSSAAAAAADKKLYGDLNFNPQTSSSSSSWTDKYEESDKNNVLINKRDMEEEERDIIYSIEKSLDRFSSMSRSLEDNCPSPGQLNRCCG